MHASVDGQAIQRCLDTDGSEWHGFKAGGGGESSYDSSASIAGDACWIPDPDGDLSTNAGSRKFVEYGFAQVLVFEPDSDF